MDEDIYSILGKFIDEVMQESDETRAEKERVNSPTTYEEEHTIPETDAKIAEPVCKDGEAIVVQDKSDDPTEYSVLIVQALFSFEQLRSRLEGDAVYIVDTDYYDRIRVSARKDATFDDAEYVIRCWSYDEMFYNAERGVLEEDDDRDSPDYIAVPVTVYGPNLEYNNTVYIKLDDGCTPQSAAVEERMNIGANHSNPFASLLGELRKIGDVTIPEGITEIEDGAFFGRTELTSITIPSSVRRIGEHAFCGCTGLTSVTIMEGVTEIGFCAFSGCTALKSITIPSSVKTIVNCAFDGCTALKEVHISDITAWCGIDIQDEGEDTCTNPLSCAHNLYLEDFLVTDLVLPRGVTEISYRAFQGCTGLTSVTIPSSVKTIETFAFQGCTGLKEVTIHTGVTKILDGAFWDCTGLIEAKVPHGLDVSDTGIPESCRIIRY